MKLKDIFKFLGQKTVVDFRREPAGMASQIDASVLYNAISMAEQGRTRELFALYRDMLVSDGHAQSEMAKRKLAVINEPLMFLPYEKGNAQDQEAADGVKDALSDCKNLFRGWTHLLDSCLYPVSVVEKVFTFDPSTQTFKLVRLVPVPHTLLDFYTGALKIRDGRDPEDLSKAFLPDPERYIVHRGNLSTLPDQWGGPMRSILFWWLLSTCDRSWWARFLEKYGAPFTVGKYASGDEQSKNILERAFSSAARLGGLVVSSETEIEMKQAAASDAGDAFEKFHATANREKSKIIIGQTLSADAQSTGLNSSVGSSQEAVRSDIRRFDAAALSETIRNELFAQIHRINRLPGRPPVPQFGSIQNIASATIRADMLYKFKQAGLEVDDSGLPTLSDESGLPLRRSSAPSFNPVAFSSESVSPKLDLVASATSSDLARAFRGSHAEIARIIRESKSVDDCRSKLVAFTASMRPGQSAAVIQSALTAYASNGLASTLFR